MKTMKIYSSCEEEDNKYKSIEVMVKISPSIYTPDKEENGSPKISKLTRDIYLEKLEKTYKKPKKKCTLKLVFHPENFLRMAWDVVMLILIIYQALTVPYYICFNDDYTGELQSFEVVVTVFFLTDIIISFNTGFYDKGSLVIKRRQIIKSYLKLWFWIDLLATFPYTWIIESIYPPSSESTNDSDVYNAPKIIRIIRIIRFLRILKLLRLAKLKKILIKIEDYIASSIIASLFLVFRLLSGSFLVAHWLACLWFFLGSSGQDIHPITWITVAGIQDKSNWEQYVTSLYWAFTTIATVGYGDIAPITLEEKIFAMTTMIISSGVFAYTLGSIGTLVSEQNALENTYREAMVSVNSYMKSKRLGKDLQLRVRRYLDYLWEKKKKNKIDEKEVLELLSEPLRDEIYGYINAYIVRTCKVFESFDDTFVAQLTRSLDSETFAPGDQIFESGEISDKIYYITSGVIEIYHQNTQMVFTHLKNKAYFGEIAFFLSGKRTAAARCAEFSDLLSLSRSDLLFFLEKYPEADFFVNELQESCKDSDFSRLFVRCYLCDELGHIASRCKAVILNLDHQDTRCRWLEAKTTRKSVKVGIRTFPRFVRNNRKRVRPRVPLNPAGPMHYQGRFQKEQEFLNAVQRAEAFLDGADSVPSTRPTDKPNTEPTPTPVLRPRFSLFGNSEISEEEVRDYTPQPYFGLRLPVFSTLASPLENNIKEEEELSSPEMKIYKVL
jgi:hyperpolarization activated cyclic nucleotide-gated potassium channel 2